MRISDWSSDVCSSDLKVAVGEHLAVEQRVAPRQQVDQEHPQAGDGDAGFGPDLDAVEPVLLRTAVEHELERGKAEREHRETEQVELAVATPGRGQQRPHQDRKSTRLNSSH